MKPRNKTERRVVELSATMPPLRQYDAERIDKDYRRQYKNKGLSYYLILERCKEFQVIRYYYKTSRSLFEFAQVWLNKDCKVAMAKNRFMGVDNWVRDSEITIKDWFRYGHEYTYLGGFDRIGWSGCFIRSLLPELKKRGLRTSNHGINPLDLCVGLLGSNRLETLFKVRQYRLVSYFSYSYRPLTNTLWQAIRVALRHGYHWDSNEELRDWCDMVNDLQYLGLDTRNPHYICPANLKEAHQRFINLRHRKSEIERWANEIKCAEAYEPFFAATREQFFDMLFTDNELSISIIKSARGIKEEGKAMHHCVGGYYNNPNSLILSATIGGKRIETIEVSLADYKLVQSRGLQNCSTRYHGRIVKLIKDNLDTIRVLNENHKSIEKKKLKELRKAS